MKVSVVIVTHQSRNDVGGCLEAVHRSLADVGHEVIAVDNGSTDGTVSVLAGRVDHLLENRANDGFARAANQGAAIARGRFLVFLNPDARPRGNCLTTLVRWLESHPGAGAAGPILVDEAGALQWNGGHPPSVWRVWWGAVSWSRGYQRVEAGIGGVVGWILGACLVTRAGAFRAVGGFDEGFFFYGEDKDFCARLRSRAWSCHVVREARCGHRGGGSGGNPECLGSWFYRAQGRYAQRHMGPVRARVALVAIWCSARLRSAMPFGSEGEQATRRAFHRGRKWLKLSFEEVQA